MFNIDFTFLWAALTLLIIYVFVKKFLFSRLGAYMEKRSAGIAADIEQAKSFKSESEQMRTQNEALLKSANERQRTMLDEARGTADREYARIVNDAKQEAARIKNEARVDIEHERAQMQRDLANEITTLAIAAASRIMESNMDNELNRTLVDRFLAENNTEGVA